MGLVEVKTGEASISLPKPSSGGKVSVEKAIKGRRTVRDFRQKSLSLNHLSQLAWSGQGITDSSENKRAAASAGALYPLDLYILTGENGVEKMEGASIGIYQRNIPSCRSQKEIAGERLPWPLYLRCGWLEHPSSLSSQLNIEGSPGSMVKGESDMPSSK